MSVTWGLDPKARSITVYYEGSDTIYEGDALCYNYDSTTNWMGVDGSKVDFTTTASTASLESTSTAEGYQNEGKFLRVEKPATANLQFFAGVLVGNASGFTGPGAVDIYVPNGAIVPVRSYVSSTVGVTALAIQNAQYYLGNPAAGTTNGAARYVAIAMETVDRSSTKGLCLAKLCPNEFLYTSSGSTKMLFATAGTVDVAAHFINVDSNQTSGGFTALWVRSNVDTAANSDTALAIYGEANVNGVAAGEATAVRGSMNIWAGTQTQGFYGLYGEVYHETATLTSATVAALKLRTQIATAPSKHYMIECRCDGADTPDGLLYAVSATAIGWASKSGSATFDGWIPIKVAGSTTYIPTVSAIA